jgi:caffeoyl-CoA O-methyltransferase
MVFEKWNKGGFMIVDNVLYNSEILDVAKASKNGKAIDKFNKKIEQDTRVENVLLPFRDGIMLIYKK